MTRILRRSILYLIPVALLIAIVAAYVGYRYLTTATYRAETPLLFQLAPGTGFSQLARQLENKGVLENPQWWKVYAVITRQAQQIQAGEYRIQPGVTPLELLALFTSGDVVPYQVTFVEGWRFEDMMAELARQEKLSHELAGLSTAEIMTVLGRPDEHPEGLFFPDSYQYVAGSRDVDIVRRAQQRLEKVLEEEWQGRASNLPYETPYEALIMASIIEKETGVPEERGEIAGVFVRRLKKGMRLQTDPTVIYGLGRAYKGNLKRKHLSQPTPYNTYVIRGLPPTPIALVGRAAIHAALNPLPGSSLYFVARGDGSHLFSDTLEQHNQAVRHYQINRRSNNYRSSPKN